MLRGTHCTEESRRNNGTYIGTWDGVFESRQGVSEVFRNLNAYIAMLFFVTQIALLLCVNEWKERKKPAETK
jgi:preprotein translocase subunit SecG